MALALAPGRVLEEEDDEEDGHDAGHGGSPQAPLPRAGQLSHLGAHNVAHAAETRKKKVVFAIQNVPYRTGMAPGHF